MNCQHVSQVWRRVQPIAGRYTMRGVEIFDLYRLLLAIVGGAYTVIRGGMMLSRWLSWTDDHNVRWGKTIRRYFTVQLLRTRIRRFAFELLQIGTLLVVLGYLVHLNLLQL